MRIKLPAGPSEIRSIGLPGALACPGSDLDQRPPLNPNNLITAQSVPSAVLHRPHTPPLATQVPFVEG